VLETQGEQLAAQEKELTALREQVTAIDERALKDERRQQTMHALHTHVHAAQFGRDATLLLSRAAAADDAEGLDDMVS